MAEGLPFLDDAESDEGPWRGVHADGVHADGMHLCEEHDFLWGYATTPGTVAYRGAMFAALRRVVSEFGPRTSWLELLQHTNEQLCAWSANRPAQLAISSMEIRSTCRGAAFGPADLVWGLEDAHEDASEEAAALPPRASLPDAAESCPRWKPRRPSRSNPLRRPLFETAHIMQNFSLSTCISILMHVTLALITPNALTFQLRTLE